MARLIHLLEGASEGERRTADTLRSQLPDTWVVIWNVLVMGFGGTSKEVDFVVVGDHGVYLADDKSWNGRVVAGKGYYIVDGDPKPNPVEKAEMVARTVAAQLREGVPGLSGALGKAYFLHAFVSLSGHVDLQKTDRDSTARVVLAERLPQVLLGFDRLPEKGALPVVDHRDAIVDYLTAGRQGIEPSILEPDNQPKEARESAAVAAASAPPPTDTPAVRRRRSVLSWVPVACLVAIAVALAFIYWSSQPVRWDEATARVGKITTVYGPVVQARKKPKWGDLSYINVGRDFRPGSPTPFYLRIDPEYRAAVEAELKRLTGNSPSPWDAYGTKAIWVKGQVLEDDYNGAYMLVTSAKDIHVGEPGAQSSYLIAALAAAGLAVAWTVALVVKSARRAKRPAANGGNAP